MRPIEIGEVYQIHYGPKYLKAFGPIYHHRHCRVIAKAAKGHNCLVVLKGGTNVIIPAGNLIPYYPGMIESEHTHRTGKYAFKVRVWNCCENLWELLLSSRYPERYTWKPVCPTCGSTIKAENKV